MIYLSGVTNDRDEPRLIAAGVGLMAQPGNSYHLRLDRYPWWAADNGCFADRWDEDTHLAWLDRLPRDRCLFAVAPDVYPDATESLRRGLSYAPLLREMGFPVAVVAQDGAERLSWPWDDLDCVFLGGERKAPAAHEWKIGPGAEQLARRARAEGKWVHMGRVNSLTRLERARSMGCTSADGTFIKWRRRLKAGEHPTARDGRGAGEVGQWVVWLDGHRTLPGFTTFETPSHPVHREAVGV